MADGIVQLPFTNTTSGKILDTTELTIAGNTVERERMVLGNDASSALAPVTSSGGLLVTLNNPTTQVNTLTSGPVTIAGTVSVVSASSGLVQTLTSGPVTVSGTVTIVSASSGLVQTLSSGPVLLSSAGLTPIQVTGSSGAVAPATSSGGLGVTIIAGAGAGSTAVNLPTVSAAGFAPVTSSAGLLANLSSGTITISGSVSVVNASSGIVQTLISPSSAKSYTVFAFNASSSASVTNITAAATILYGWNMGNQESGQQVSVKLYNSTAPTIGSTTNLILSIPIPGSTAGSGNNFWLEQGTLFTSALSVLVTDNFAATSTALGHSAGDVIGNLYYI